MDRLHAHPLNAVEVIPGQLLQAGEKLQVGDLFSSMTGTWTPVPSIFIGNIIPPSFGATFIRPALRSVK